MYQGNLFVISGPSGAGKGTLVARLMSEVSDCCLSISVTTRAPRGDEQHGREYYFVSEEEFKALIEQDGLLEWALVHGSYYGTPRKLVEEHIEDARQVVLEIDVQGALQVREKMPEAILVFIAPPSLDILFERLVSRGTDSEEAIARRMKTAEVELALKDQYDKQIVNDSLDRATEELVAFVLDKRHE